MENEQIEELFKEYVELQNGEERHTQKCQETCDEFDKTLQIFVANWAFRKAISDDAMDMAVEFEESGFINGFKAGYEKALEDLREEK